MESVKNQPNLCSKLISNYNGLGQLILANPFILLEDYFCATFPVIFMLLCVEQTLLVSNLLVFLPDFAPTSVKIKVKTEF